MKILIVTTIFPPDIGGPATYSSELLKRLPPKIKVKVLTFGDNKGSHVPNVYKVGTKGGMLTRQINFFLMCLKLGVGSDLLYLQEPAVVGLSGLIAGKILGKKTIVKYVGDPAWEKLRQDGKNPGSLNAFLTSAKPRNWLFRITKFVLTKSDKVVTPAKYLKELLSESYNLPKRKIVVIPNSVSPEIFNVKKIRFSAVTVGRLVNWKNIDLIISAMKLVNKALPKSKLTILGGGPESEKLKNLAGMTTIFKEVLSPKETLTEIAKSEILILYSDYEGLPHVAIEAQSLGTAVIASNIPGTDEVVKNGKTGLLLSPKNVDSLAVSIKKLFIDNRLRTTLAQNALREVKKNFLWEKNLRKLIQVLNEVNN